MQFRSFLLGHTHTSNGSFWPRVAARNRLESARSSQSIVARESA